MAGVLRFDDGGREFVSWQVCYLLMVAVMSLCRGRWLIFLMAAVMSICDIRLY